MPSFVFNYAAKLHIFFLSAKFFDVFFTIFFLFVTFYLTLQPKDTERA